MVVLLKLTCYDRAIKNCVQHLLSLLQDGQGIIFNRSESHLIAEILLDICQDCSRMAALPQGAFAACKLRENHRERELLVSRLKTGDAKNLFDNKKSMEYSPAKYNGKLMNSIWGLYNRYSPHNIKGNDFESNDQGGFVQQRTAVASYAIAQNMAMAMDASGKEWRFLEK